MYVFRFIYYYFGLMIMLQQYNNINFIFYWVLLPFPVE